MSFVRIIEANSNISELSIKVVEIKNRTNIPKIICEKIAPYNLITYFFNNKLIS